MKFTLSTKPLNDALDLGVIPKNISKFYHKSCIAQLTATRNQLKINLESNHMCTEILLKGSGDTEETVSIFVDCLMLKQLVNTFDSSVVTLSFVDHEIIFTSGGSDYHVPEMSDVEGSLAVPQIPGPDAVTVSIDKSDWKFIQSHQMYAIAVSFTFPVYTRVWVGDSGDVIIGDYNSSLFTFSNKSNLGKTCLLNDTAINVLNSVPEGATITNIGKSYRIDLKTDAFEYASEFTPQYESDEGVGSYNSDTILPMKPSMIKDDSAIVVSAAAVSKFMNQADVLASASKDNVMTLSYKDKVLEFKDSNIDCKVPVESSCFEFSASFVYEKLKAVISHMDSETFMLKPIQDDNNDIVGIGVVSDNLAVMLGCKEDTTR